MLLDNIFPTIVYYLLSIIYIDTVEQGGPLWIFYKQSNI